MNDELDWDDIVIRMFLDRINHNEYVIETMKDLISEGKLTKEYLLHWANRIKKVSPKDSKTVDMIYSQF